MWPPILVHTHSSGDLGLLDIGDATVPEAIREHGHQFRKPARVLADLGNGGYILFAEDGAVLDMVILHASRIFPA